MKKAIFATLVFTTLGAACFAQTAPAKKQSPSAAKPTAATAAKSPDVAPPTTTTKPVLEAKKKHPAAEAKNEKQPAKKS